MPNPVQVPRPARLPRPTQLLRRAGLLTGALTVAALLAACSSSGGGSGDGADRGASGSNAANGAAPADMKTVSISLSTDGCKPQHTSYNTGPLTFEVKNTNAAGVSEVEVLSEDRILGEKENLAPGFSGTFSLVLQPGSYTVYCPGATTERTTFAVTGQATSQAATTVGALLKQGAAQYKGYVTSQTDQLVTVTKPLVTAIQQGNLSAAQAAYAKARPYYERIEPVAESFTSGSQNLDSDIDARIDDVDSPAQWKGFHKIEKALFADRTTSGMASVAATLMTNITKLQSLVHSLPGFQPAELANGAVGLLDEAAKTKIHGEEERYSKIDMLDLSANIEGSQQAFAYLEDGLKKIDPTLVATIKAAFAKVQALVDTFKDPSQPSGYKLYNTVPKADITKLAQEMQAVAEPLSRVAGKVAAAQ